MNNLVERIKDNKFPILFKENDMKKLGLNIKTLNNCLNDALDNNLIKNIYDDTYILSKNLNKSVLSKYVLAQLIDPKSYISTYYVLRDWMLDEIFSISSVTEKENNFIFIKDYGKYMYENIYNNNVSAGIYWKNDIGGKYKIAKPLRALCDLLYFRKAKEYSIEYIEDTLRIYRYVLEEELKKEDFDELQGKLGIEILEEFLIYLKKELKI